MQILKDSEINGHHIYLTDNNYPILFPCLYAKWTVKHGLSINEKSKKNKITNVIEHYFEESEISEDAQGKRLTYLSHFLDWVDSDESPEQVNLGNHTALPAD
ncbi:site-specific integrase, partial [Vibrio parahaemolyticus]|nr:site-specific integrase [Vibrio parahaemolyticus]